MRGGNAWLPWIAALGALALGVSALATTEHAPEVDVEALFANADTDGDGFIDRREYFETVTFYFLTLDEDKDGYLLLADLEGVSEEEFRAADRDGDGRISLDEYVDARFEDFDAADANGDGLLSLQDVLNFDAQLD